MVWPNIKKNKGFIYRQNRPRPGQIFPWPWDVSFRVVSLRVPRLPIPCGFPWASLGFPGTLWELLGTHGTHALSSLAVDRHKRTPARFSGTVHDDPHLGAEQDFTASSQTEDVPFTEWSGPVLPVAGWSYHAVEEVPQLPELGKRASEGDDRLHV